jgi:HEAT repeat protein
MGEPWKDELRDADSSVRLNAAIMLARQGDAAGVDVLIEALDHESWAVRYRHAARALATLGEPARPALEAALRSGGTRRVCAAVALHRFDPASVGPVVAALEATLRDEDPEARRDAAYVLGTLGETGRAAATSLARLLRNEAEREDIRAEAAVALAASGALAAADAVPLFELLHSDAWWVRSRASDAAQPLLATSAPFSTRLIEALSDPGKPGEVRADLARLLGRSTPALSPVVSALAAALRDGEFLVRLYAARSLAALGSAARATAPALVAALEDADYNVRRNAARALARVAGEAAEAVTALARALRQPHMGGVSAEALASLGEVAVSALAEALADPSPEVQRFAAYGLAQLGSPAAVADVTAWTARTGAVPYAPRPEDFALPALPVEISDEARREFEQLFESSLAQGAGSRVRYSSARPRYEFLAYLARERGCVFHGSVNADIDVLKPIRWSQEGDDGEAGNVNGVYGTPDEILPIFYGIVERRTHQVGIMNGPIELPDAQGGTRKFYHYSINAEMLPHQPWVSGVVYVLPRATFEAGHAGWYSRTPVRPLLKLPVTPEDFPFLASIMGYDARNVAWPTLDGVPFLHEVEHFPLCPAPPG